MRDAGHDDAAEAIDGADELKAYDDEAKRFDDRMNRAKFAGEKRRAAAAVAKKAAAVVAQTFKETLADELNVLAADGGIEKIADELEAEAKKKGLKGAAAVAHVKAGVDRFVRAQLKNVAVPIGHEHERDEQVGDLATAAARQARVRAVAAGKAQEVHIDAARAQVAEGRAKEGAGTFEESVKGSGATAFAGRLLAKLTADGGANDRFGNFQKMTPAQIQAQVQRHVEQWLHRRLAQNDRFGRAQFANRGMGSEETGLVASRITHDAGKDVNARVAGLAGTQLDNTGRLLAVAGQLDAQIAELQVKANEQQFAINQLGGNVRQRNNQNRGNR